MLICDISKFYYNIAKKRCCDDSFQLTKYTVSFKIERNTLSIGTNVFRDCFCHDKTSLFLPFNVKIFIILHEKHLVTFALFQETEVIFNKTLTLLLFVDFCFLQPPIKSVMNVQRNNGHNNHLQVTMFSLILGTVLFIGFLILFWCQSLVCKNNCLHYLIDHFL